MRGESSHRNQYPLSSWTGSPLHCSEFCLQSHRELGSSGEVGCRRVTCTSAAGCPARMGLLQPWGLSLLLVLLPWTWGTGNLTLQGLLGCELAPDNSSLPTALFALNGEEFMQFDPKSGNWSGEWPETEAVAKLWMKKPEVAREESEFLLVSCPERLLGHLERGSAYLTWREPPSMRLKAGPSSSPGSSVLTCTAFSFYPPELKLSFLRNGLSVGTGDIDFGPNGDGSFHAWSLLEIKSGEEHHYQCHVEHPGLAQPLLVELDSPARSSVPVVGIILGFLVVLVVTAGGVLLWMRMRSGLPAPWLSLSGDDVGDLLPSPSLPREADPQDENAFPATA